MFGFRRKRKLDQARDSDGKFLTNSRVDDGTVTGKDYHKLASSLENIDSLVDKIEVMGINRLKRQKDFSILINEGVSAALEGYEEGGDMISEIKEAVEIINTLKDLRPQQQANTTTTFESTPTEPGNNLQSGNTISIDKWLNKSDKELGLIFKLAPKGYKENLLKMADRIRKL